MEQAVKNLMFDLASGRDIYDEEQGRVMSKAEANDAIRRVCFEKLGLTKDSTDKQIRRALKKDSALELFEVIEEVIEPQISYGLSANEFFNEFVETKNLADGDRNEFWVEDDVILNVSKVAGDHHDLSLQRLASGSAFNVPTATYAVKVGGDIRLFLTGRKDWTDFTEAVAKAYVQQVQTMIQAEWVNGTTKITPPSVLTGTGALGAGTKAAFDAIIEKVQAANEADVVIMGTKTALKNLNELAAASSVAWVAQSQKESVANTGILGSYEGTTLIEVPQKFKDKTLATPLVDNSKIWILPLVDNKPIKFVDYGETELEVTEVGDTVDDMQSYEVQRRMGVSTIMTRYYGVWTIA